MKIIEENGGLLTNIEVLHVLKDREADKQAVISKALPSEIKAHDALVQSCGIVQTREQVQAFLEAVKHFELTKAELVQLINLKPTSPVEIYLCIEDCETRLEDEQVEELLQIVKQHLPNHTS